jgi:hypothetical protein
MDAGFNDDHAVVFRAIAKSLNRTGFTTGSDGVHERDRMGEAGRPRGAAAVCNNAVHQISCRFPEALLDRSFKHEGARNITFQPRSSRLSLSAEICMAGWKLLQADPAATRPSTQMPDQRREC